MLADFDITRHSNNMKTAVQKNLVGQILYSLVHAKKTASMQNFIFIGIINESRNNQADIFLIMEI